VEELFGGTGVSFCEVAQDMMVGELSNMDMIKGRGGFLCVQMLLFARVCVEFVLC
jgi:hypothetical protein